MRSVTAPGVTANWTPVAATVALCHCGGRAVICGPPLCAGHAQTAVVSAGVVRRRARVLVELLATNADVGRVWFDELDAAYTALRDALNPDVEVT